MPKRKLEESYEEWWLRKMKKYEQKLERKQRRRIQRTIDSNDSVDVQPQEHLESNLDVCVEESIPTESQPVVDITAPSNETVDPDPVVELEVPNVSTDFDADLLRELGDVETEPVDYGDDLQTDVAERFQKILQGGLRKETKEELLKKYSFPKNVPFSKGPTLNPEISAMLIDKCRLRDKKLLTKQDQLGKALSALGKGLSLLLKKKPDIPDIIRTLNDAGKLLSDSHYTETDTRRTLIIPLVDKSLSEPFKDRKRDNFLFGEKLGDLVKNSRGIKKTGQLIKATSSISSNLNAKGPPSRTRQQHSGQTYPSRAGGPKPTTSYRFTSFRRATAPLPPPPPPPPAWRQQPHPPRRPPAQTARRDAATRAK